MRGVGIELPLPSGPARSAGGRPDSGHLGTTRLQLTPDDFIIHHFIIPPSPGPGAADLITVRGLHLVRTADVVAYDALVHPDLLSEVRRDAERVYVGKRDYCVGSTRQDAIYDVLVARARASLSVVRLKGATRFCSAAAARNSNTWRPTGWRARSSPG